MDRCKLYHMLLFATLNTVLTMFQDTSTNSYLQSNHCIQGANILIHPLITELRISIVPPPAEDNFSKQTHSRYANCNYTIGNNRQAVQVCWR